MDSRTDDASSVSPSLTNDDQNKASHMMDDDDLEENGLNNVQSSGTKQKITRKRYTKGMVSFLLDTVDEIVPTSNRDWEAVATKFNLEFNDNRDLISVRKKFLDLASKASIPALQTSENAKADLVAKKINAKLGPGTSSAVSTEQSHNANASWESSSVVSSVNGAADASSTATNKGRNKPSSSSPSADHPLKNEDDHDDARDSLLGKRSKDELYATNTTANTYPLPTAQSKGLSAILYRILHRPIVRTPHTNSTSSNQGTHNVSAEATRNQSPNSVSSSQGDADDSNNLHSQLSHHEQGPSTHTDLVYDAGDPHHDHSNNNNVMDCDDSVNTM